MTDILNLLKNASREKPISRYEIELHGMNERTFRREVEKLRNQGYRICSSSQTKGYWLAENEADYRRFASEQVARIRKMSKQLKAMNRNLPGQLKMGE